MEGAKTASLGYNLDVESPENIHVAPEDLLGQRQPKADESISGAPSDSHQAEEPDGLTVSGEVPESQHSPRQSPKRAPKRPALDKKLGGEAVVDNGSEGRHIQNLQQFKSSNMLDWMQQGKGFLPSATEYQQRQGDKKQAADAKKGQQQPAPFQGIKS